MSGTKATYSLLNKISAAIEQLNVNVTAEAVVEYIVAEVLSGNFILIYVLDDAAGVSDETVLGLVKQFAEDTQVSEQKILEVGKQLQDDGIFTDEEILAFSKFLAEAPLITEQHTISFSRAVPDEEALVQDAELRSFVKNLTSNVYATDDVDGEASILDDQEIQFFKNVTHVASASDSLSIQASFVRLFSESSAVSEAFFQNVGKQFSEATALQDDIIRDASKNTSEIIGVGETYSGHFETTRADTGLVADALVNSFSKTFADSIVLNDDLGASIVYERDFYNTANVTDDVDGLASILDDQEISFVKTNNNTLFVAETDVLGVGKVLEETTSFADAGSLVSQGYCDLSYFDSDYVGAIRTF